MPHCRHGTAGTECPLHGSGTVEPMRDDATTIQTSRTSPFDIPVTSVRGLLVLLVVFSAALVYLTHQVNAVISATSVRPPQAATPTQALRLSAQVTRASAPCVADLAALTALVPHPGTPLSLPARVSLATRAGLAQRVCASAIVPATAEEYPGYRGAPHLVTDVNGWLSLRAAPLANAAANLSDHLTSARAYAALYLDARALNASTRVIRTEVAALGRDAHVPIGESVLYQWATPR